jgi:hypothetical protein
MDREKWAAEAFTGVERVMLGRNFAESHAALEKFIADFSDTAFPSENSEGLRALEARIDQFRWHTGLWAKYYSGDARNLRKTFHYARPLTHLQQDWGNNGPGDGVPSEFFEIEMTGVLRVTEAGEYTFSYNGDDKLELYLDGKNLGNRKTNVQIQLTAGDHPIKLNYANYPGVGHMWVKWKPPGKQNEETIPDGQFLYLPETGEGK